MTTLPQSATIFDLAPVAKPRMTQSDKWQRRPAVVRYWAFKDRLCQQAQERGFELGESFRVTFYLPMPRSWSRAKRARMEGQPHRDRPDLDNIIKALEDSLLPDNDSGVWAIEARKVWASEGRIVIENLDIERGY